MRNKQSSVLAHLQKNGSITQMEAWDLYRASRLSSIIFRLKRAGHTITAERMGDGSGTTWVRYHLQKEDA